MPDPDELPPVSMAVFGTDGNPTRLDVLTTDALTEARDAGAFVWVGLVDPTAADLKPFAHLLGLHPVAVDAAASEDQQPKVQDLDDQLLLVFWSIAESPDDDDAVLKFFIIVGDGYLVTVQRNITSHRIDVSRCFTERPAFLQNGAAGALYLLLAAIAKHYAGVISATEKELDALEQEVFDQAVLDDSTRIYQLRKRIGRMERPLSSLVNSLLRGPSLSKKYAAQHPRLTPYLDDAVGDLISVGELAQDQENSLDNVVSSHESNVSVRQNNDTRKISAIGALLAVPTVIAGLYGMNFDQLPGVEWDLGWLVVLGVIAATDAALVVTFKRRGWL